MEDDPQASRYGIRMSFNDDARLNPSRVRDTRGSRRGTKIAVGGGGILLLIVASLFGINPGLLEGLGIGSTTATPSGRATDTPAISECATGADANERTDCRILATAQSLDAFWVPYLEGYGRTVELPGVEIFSDSVDTACGTASSQVGPFYCPGDTTAYFDTGFFTDLREDYGAEGGALAEEYVVAHEYGHHIQNTIGTLKYSRQGGTGPTSGSVRVELQADCFAGLWAAHAARTADSSGEMFLEPFTEADLRSALSAAAAVGDDRIQEAATGRVSPEGWTHGSAKQRQAWFLEGYRNGDINRCNTLAAEDLNNP
jgi:predicted metalloprotease